MTEASSTTARRPGVRWQLGALLVSGCMAETRVAPAVIRDAASASLNAPRPVNGDADRAVLGPLTWLRGVAATGTVTPWHEAGDLWLSEAGLTERPVSLDQLQTARVSGLDGDAERRLQEERPRDARSRVTSGFGVVTLHAERPGVLLPWALRFLARTRALGKPLGRWELDDRAVLGGFAAEAIGGGPLEVDPAMLLEMGEAAQTLAAAHGIPWFTAERAFELKYFNPGGAAVWVIPAWPLLVLLAVVHVAAGGSLSDDTGYSGGGPTVLLPGPVLAAARPLFTPAARRRALVTALASVGGAGGVSADASGGVTASLRWTELLETGAFARSIRASATDVSPAATRLVVGGRLGVHVPLGPASAWAIAAGADIGAAVAGGRFRAAGFYGGVRRAWGERAFIEVQPFMPTWVGGEESGRSTMRLRWLVGLSIGLEF